MPLYLNTTGLPHLTVALCDRCRRKFPIGELHPDPNLPGLMVCAADRDFYDPYKLPPRVAEGITPPFIRREFDIATNPGGAISEDGNSFLISEDGDYFLIYDGTV